MVNRPEDEVDLHRLELRFAATRVSDARAVQRLADSIEACGQRVACIAVAQDTDGAQSTHGAMSLVLIDGYRRVAALRKLGRDTARVECWQGSASQALAQVLAGSQSRAFCAIEEAMLLRELMGGQALSQREVALACGRDVSWVHRRLSLLGALPETLVQAVRLGQVSVWAATRVIAPLARANAAHAQRLLDSVSRPQGALSTRELSTWFAHYQCAQREQRERMVDHPRLLLDSVSARAQDQAAAKLKGGPEGQVVADLGHLQGLAERVRRQLCAMSSPVSAPVVLACRRARAALAQVDSELRRCAHDTRGDVQHSAFAASAGPCGARDQQAAAPVA